MSKVAELTPMEAAEQFASLSAPTRMHFERWKALRWGEDEQPYGGFAAIGAAIVSKRNPVTPDEMKALFAFAEQLLQQGSGEVANMVATSFLEELWHATRDRNFDFSSINRLLGAESRAYLVAWDQFNKTKTPGLAER